MLFVEVWLGLHLATEGANLVVMGNQVHHNIIELQFHIESRVPRIDFVTCEPFSESRDRCGTWHSLIGDPFHDGLSMESGLFSEFGLI